MRWHSLLLLFFILGCTSNIQAQDDPVPLRFRGGLSLGFATSQVSGDDLAGFNKVGVFGGAFVSTRLSDKWEMQLELDYVMKGSRRTPKPENGNSAYTLRLNYLELPLLFRSDIRKFRYEFGPYFGVLVSSYEALNDLEVPATREFKPVEIGGLVGLSYAIGDHTRIVWRFSNSLLPIRNHANNATFRWNLGQYNTCLNFFWQYTF